MAVGDVNSAERGSGARFNGGKVQLEYIPARIIADFYDEYEDEKRGILLLRAIADYEEGKDGTNALRRALFHAMPLVGGVERWRLPASAYEFGAKKYAPWNWAKGMPWSVPLACIKRHMIAIFEGEAFDPESEVHHYGHVSCNIIMLLHYADHYREGDDRPSARCFSGGWESVEIEHVGPVLEPAEYEWRQEKATIVPAVDIKRNALPGDPQFMGVDPETGDGRCNDPSCLCNRWAEIDHELRPIPGPRDVDACLKGRAQRSIACDCPSCEVIRMGGGPVG